jgi:hypothetical protein
MAARRVSAAGAKVRDRRSQLTDSVVDGGYFDNSGIVTALDIARGIKALDGGLLPLAPQDLTVTGLAKALPYSWAEQERSIGFV